MRLHMTCSTFGSLKLRSKHESQYSNLSEFTCSVSVFPFGELKLLVESIGRTTVMRNQSSLKPQHRSRIDFMRPLSCCFFSQRTAIRNEHDLTGCSLSRRVIFGLSKAVEPCHPFLLGGEVHDIVPAARDDFRGLLMR